MKLSKMMLSDAQQISGWNYAPPYSFYNSDGSADTIEEYIDGTYYAVHNDEGDLIGFYCSEGIPGSWGKKIRIV